MKATGIVRRIDDLGRVVIPKEIRRTLRIKEGDPLEIFTASDGEVIFKKYSPLGEISEFSGQYSEVLNRISGVPIIITDSDHVISVSGIPKKDVLEKHLSKEMEELLQNRENYIKSKSSYTKFHPIENVEYEAAIALPIISSGDISGSVIFLMDEKGALPTETEIKLAQVAATFLGKQMEE
ncbi:MAG: stage V sporulation T C-terminal domain-containing protein [Acutalibacteraceae bacterium]